MARFIVEYRIRGTSMREIEADSFEEATIRIEAELEEDDFSPEVDEVVDCDYDIREMYHISREGEKLWTTYVRPGDTRIEAPPERESA